MSTPTYTALQLYKRLLFQVQPYWLHLAGVFLLGLLATPVTLLWPLPVKIVVDSVLGSAPLPKFLHVLLPSSLTVSPGMALAVAAGLLLCLALLAQLQGLGSWLLSEYTGEKMVLHFRSQLFQQAQRLSLAYHDAQGISDATYRIQYDAPAIYGLAIWGLIPLITTAVTLLSMIYVTARLSLLLALVALAVSPIVVLLTWLYSRRLRTQWEGVKELETSALSVIQEVLGAIRVVKAFRQEEQELDRFVTRSSDGLWERIRVVLTECSLSFCIGLTLGLGTMAVLFVGVQQVQAGELTLGNLLLIMAYLGQLYSPLHTIGKQIAEQQGALVSVERAFSLLDQAPAVIERQGAMPISRARGSVVFRHVSFAYSDGHRVLHDISFEVPTGTRVGIAGPTGAGKTTLISLLIRFYDPTDGEIRLDGVDLRDYRLDDLRHQFAIVPQEPVLFSNSIAANIAYARPEANMAEIIAAARAANAHDFIIHLPQGYDTPVGARGMSLSGGERQRVALARAFLKDAPILVLDEPTSSVDIETEATIVDAMQYLMEGRTSFIIAHRLSTLEGCDMRLNLVKGRLRGSKAGA